jgi:hypothetical protein
MTTYQLEPGQAPLSVTVEGGDPWGDRRLHRKHDARWRGIARQFVDERAPGGAGYIRCLAFGASVDSETLTIGTRIYELDFVPDGVTAGSVAVDCSGVVTAANLAVAIAGAINGDADREVDAAVIDADKVIFVPRTNWGTAGNLAIVSTIAVADVVLSGALMVGGELPATVRRCQGSYTVTAADVLALTAGDVLPIGSVPWANAPAWTQLQLESSVGLLKPLSGSAAVDEATYGWAPVNGNRRALLLSATVAVGLPFAAGDVIHWQTTV